MCGFCVVVVVVVNDVIYSRFDFGLVDFGVCALSSISPLNENGSEPMVVPVDSLLVTSFDDGCRNTNTKKKQRILLSKPITGTSNDAM